MLPRMSTAATQYQDWAARNRCLIGGRGLILREFNCECAADPGSITYPQRAAVCLHAASTNVETQAKAGAVCTTLNERDKEAFWYTRREPATMVLDGNDYAVIPAAGMQAHFSMRFCKLERILQKIADCGGEHFFIHVHRDVFVDRQHRELALMRQRIQRSGACHVAQEIGKSHDA